MNRLGSWLVRLQVTSHLLVLLLALVSGIWAAHIYRTGDEARFRADLNSLVLREAVRLESETMRGAEMGITQLLGINEPLLKQVASGQHRVDGVALESRLHAARELAGARALYVFDANGRVVAQDADEGRPWGLDASTESFWKLGMNGVNSVYASVDGTDGTRYLSIVAPLFAGEESSGPVMGVVVLRLLASDLDVRLNRLGYLGMLVSPQGVVFSSTRSDWLLQMARAPLAREIEEMAASGQYGGHPVTGPKVRLLPFDLNKSVIEIDGATYLRERAPVEWQDAAGRWSLVLLGRHSSDLPLWRVLLLGVLVSTVVALLGFVGLGVVRENAARRKALERLEISRQALARIAEQKDRLTGFAMALQDARTLPALTTRFFEQLSHFLPVHQGSLYVTCPTDATQGEAVPARLRWAGGYATQGAPEVIEFGEGVLGQCALDRRMLQLDTVPEDFWRVRTGLSSATPQTLLCAPLMRDGRLLGVIELGSLEPLDTEAHLLLQQMLPVLALNLDLLMSEKTVEST